jgi:hypothetical protein
MNARQLDGSFLGSSSGGSFLGSSSGDCCGDCS